MQSGRGGDGCISFRREKYIPKGGPDGGDGGAGADVIFKASPKLSTLQDFRYRKHYKGPNGQSGSGGNRSGPSGENLIVEVPVGTVISDSETGEVIADFSDEKDEVVIAKGGRGGKGNAHFATSTRQVPRMAQPGEEGEQRSLHLELKLMADVGLVGFPNAGKSTLISQLSAARPRVADYPFTTLAPKLGVVSLDEADSFVMADLPGLIEGAHKGAGLGHQFLRHVERTKILIYVLDLAKTLEEMSEESDLCGLLFKQFESLRFELHSYSEILREKDFLVVVNKADLLPEDSQEANLKDIRDKFFKELGHSKATPKDPKILLLSGATGQGIKKMLQKIRFSLKKGL